MDKQVYVVYKVVKHFRPHLLKNHFIVFVPHPIVRALLFQQELGERRVNSMTGLQKYDLEINPIHTIKSHGVYRLVVEAMHVKEEEEDFAG